MQFVVIQHVPFETPGYISRIMEKRGDTAEIIHIYRNENLPDPRPGVFDGVVIMGGPQSVYETDKYPYLKKEIKFIRKCGKLNIPVMGICLGAQLLAKAYGADVYPGEKEIGWYKVYFTEKAVMEGPLRGLPQETTVFQWHGDTFDIPENMTPIGRSKSVKNQGFYGKGVLALQFHMEMTEDIIKTLIKNSMDNRIKIGDILPESGNGEIKRLIENNHKNMEILFDNFFEIR